MVTGRLCLRHTTGFIPVVPVATRNRTFRVGPVVDFSSPLWGRRLLSQYLSISTDLKLGLPKLPFWKRNKKVWAAAADHLHSRASTPQIARTMLEALRELAATKSPGRAKPNARVSPPRWGGRPKSLFCFYGWRLGAVMISRLFFKWKIMATIERHTVSFFSLLAATLLRPIFSLP